MIPELGIFSLLLAWVFSILLIVLPCFSLRADPDLAWIQARRLVGAVFAFISLAYVALTISFLTNDFSVLYVLANSSKALPWYYKLCAVWGGHEGSMLLWIWILSAWTTAVSQWSASLDKAIRIRVVVILAILLTGFLLFLLATSNPFQRQFTLLNTMGRDLNPLLQDLGFLFHPPMLYMGYVGFAVPFAFAMAVLWLGHIEPVWSQWTRPWTLAAWCCLTLGITLGSWWAYRELGWGGYWFWDPVENASFMPWLAGTALIHSLMVCEKRQQFIAWTLLLAIGVFALSLIGTFLVRSGVLTSVHAFAVDPRRGLYILVFLSTVIISALSLFAIRSGQLTTKNPPALFSRESALLLNNIFVVTALLTVLLGTLYPLLIDGLGLGKLSVGSPYFNHVFIPMFLPVLALMGLGIHVKWQQDSWYRVRKIVWPYGVVSLCSLFVLFVWMKDITSALGVSFALWVILSTGLFLCKKIIQQGFFQVRLSTWGMVLAHLGIAVTCLGVAISSSFGVESDLRMAVKQKARIAGYTVTFTGEKPLQGPNYHGIQGQFLVQKGSYQKMIFPEKRVYDVSQISMTDAAIDVGVFRDLYISLGERLGQDAWGVRIYYKPFIRWLWTGGFLIFVGGFLAMIHQCFFKRISQGGKP